MQHYIRHRRGREQSILRRLGKGEADIPTLVRAIYIGLDPRLTKAAGLSVLAHLEDLVARGLVVDRRRAVDRRRLPLGGRLIALRLGAFAFFGDRRGRALRLLVADGVVDVVDQPPDARGIGAEIERAVARGRAHVDARAVLVRRASAPPRRRGSP